MGEHLPGRQRVRGSNPRSSIWQIINEKVQRAHDPDVSCASGIRIRLSSIVFVLKLNALGKRTRNEHGPNSNSSNSNSSINNRSSLLLGKLTRICGVAVTHQPSKLSSRVRSSPDACPSNSVWGAGCPTVRAMGSAETIVVVDAPPLFTLSDKPYTIKRGSNMGRRKKNRGRTRVFIVQDSSGSMSTRRVETIDGFNEYVENLKRDAEGEILLSLTQFDTNVRSVFTNEPVAEIAPLGNSDYIPGGMTALRDAVGRSIKTAESSAGKDDKVLVVIMTDGGENSSHEYTHEAILEQIKGKREDGWEFIFLGAGEEAWDAGSSLGIDARNTINYSAVDQHDHSLAFAALRSATVKYSNSGDASFDSSIKASLETKALSELNK